MDTASPNSDTSKQNPFQSRVLLGLIVVAAVIAGCTLGLIEWQRNWDNPASRDSKIAEGHFIYKGNPVSVTVNCECPQYFIESRTTSIHLTFDLNTTSPKANNFTQPGQTHSVAPEGATPQEHPTEDLSASPATSEVDVWAMVGDGSNLRWWNTYPANSSMTLAPNNRLSAGVKKRIDAVLTMNGTDNPTIVFNFGEWDNATKQYGVRFDPDWLDWRPEVRPPFSTAVTPFGVAAIVFLVLFLAIFAVDYRFRQSRRRTAAQLAQAKGEPNAAWETARIKLEAYLDRNLIQVNMVFWVAVFVMFTGFLFVLVGIYILFRDPGNLSWLKALPAISGLITQFIGATFMVIYRSTMSQANDFMSVLERINTVGMAVHELDRIPEEENDLKNNVRAHFVELLIESAYSEHSTSKRSKGTNRGKTREQSYTGTQGN